jgi:DNA-binding response OmpR family regulator
MDRVYRILIMEDELLLRTLLQRVLEDAGYAVLTAEDGREGMRVFHETHPDLVLTDILMPNVDGIEVLKALRELPERPKIIAMSGGGRSFPAQMPLRWAAKFSVDHVLAKPFSHDELLMTVKSALMGGQSSVT